MRWVVIALAFLQAGCVGAGVGPQRQSRPFYYYHSTYPEQFEELHCHGCSGSIRKRHQKLLREIERQDAVQAARRCRELGDECGK